MDSLRGGMAPRHRVPQDLPGPWPACAQGLLREGARWLQAGGGGGWGGDLLALPTHTPLEARWTGSRFETPGGLSPWEALAEAAAGPLPLVGAASYELACAEAGLPFQAPAPGTLGMSWSSFSLALHVGPEGAELWGWAEALPDPAALLPRLAPACALGRARLGSLQPAWDEAAHRAAVLDIQRRIHDGGFYVANLCTPFRAPLTGDPLTFALARLRGARAPFGAWIPLPDGALLCLSMERVLALRGDRLLTEPIKGSAPLGREAGETLGRDPKERAEHTMIVDLLRNDLGRVARTGTVKVEELMGLRAYPTVQHLVSRVEAQLRSGVGLAELLRAVLPGGSVTGAPKHAVCAHLARAEADPRGFYCGALGWIGPGGRALDLALPIRTAHLAGDRLTYWAGGGITRRSDPAREWAELELKTRVLSPGHPLQEPR